MSHEGGKLLPMDHGIGSLYEDPPDDLVKVIAAVDDTDPWNRTREGLWAEELGENRFRLWNVPWHARELN